MLHRFEIDNISMVPALLPGDYMLAIRLRRPPRRGEIVVFEHPERPGFHLVKRTVGLPGETITIIDGTVAIDGRPFDDPWAGSPTSGAGTWELGPNEIFVLGDARHASDGDGRQIGPLAAFPRMVVFARYWPRHRLGRITATGSR